MKLSGINIIFQYRNNCLINTASYFYMFTVLNKFTSSEEKNYILLATINNRT